MKLLYALVGVKGSVFSVDIEESDTIDDLKDAIKKEQPGILTCAAHVLELSFAERDDTWLSSRDDDVKDLQKVSASTAIRYLANAKCLIDASALIKEMILKANLPPLSTRQIHILVELPHGHNLKSSESAFPHSKRVIIRARKERWDRLNRKFAELVEYIFDGKYVQPVKELPQSTLNDLVTMADMKLQSYSGVYETERRYFIEPILLYVVDLFDPKERVRISIKEVLFGRYVRARGQLDFVLTHREKRVCVVEAKIYNIDKGIAQTLIGMETVSETADVETVCGIVTNFNQWTFLRHLND